MKIRVTTVVVATGAQHGESRVINYDRPAARQWLAKHCFWAYNNGFGVVSCNVADESRERPGQPPRPTLKLAGYLTYDETGHDEEFMRSSLTDADFAAGCTQKPVYFNELS